MVFRIFAALEEFERGIIRERNMAGLEAAKARGRTGERPPAMNKADITAARATLRANGISVAEVAERLRVSPSTLYRHFPGGRGRWGEHTRRPKANHVFHRGHIPPRAWVADSVIDSQ